MIILTITQANPEIEKINFVLEVVKSIGPVLAGIIILVLLILLGILYFFKGRIEAVAKEISDKAVAAFGKGLDLVFRDEALRSTLRIKLGEKSVETKLQMYEDVYSLYFRFQKSWSWDKTTQSAEIDKLLEELALMRQKVFLNSIYLGGPLTDSLLLAVIGMMDYVGDKIYKLRNEGTTLSHIYHPQPPSRNKNFEITDQLQNAQKWLEKNLVTDQNVAMYEFTADHLKLLNSERDNFFGKIEKDNVKD